MQIGKMDTRVTVRSPIYSRGEFGDAITDWINGPIGWASVQDIRGKEYFEQRSSGSVNITTHRVFMRWRSDVTVKTRLLLPDGRALNVKEVLQIGRKEGLELMCEALDDAAV
ncbi:phage head closure protein [Chitinimonas sp. PSY-7]|uniref:phage head closure protein n=1 Tax=Chitinimonas sp. PSY-7 TaxID=3459088 RepID=UPI004040229A